MKVTIVGTGYVGLVSGTCLADVGNQVLCIDTDEEKIRGLQDGVIPIYEPGLESLVRSNVESGRLRFSTNLSDGVDHGDVIFIAVGTPPEEDGSADLQHVLAVAEGIGDALIEFKVIVNKSTVPVGTADRVSEAIQSRLESRGNKIDFAVVSNPEFLKEGAAIEDFVKPDRIVVGADCDRARSIMRALYTPFNRNHDRLLLMDIRSAELTKYAANAMLATKISFMNEVSNIAERVGADIEAVRLGIGSDPRIGYHFIYPGCGYGGSCFPKDVKALAQIAIKSGHKPELLEAVERVNESQKNRLVEMALSHFGEDLTGKCFAIWGLSFKPNTHDMREAP
ncbi:MAG: UDP-glucose/GDP-mannose dehydrogenase family protein, partial [Proteobacteria bacterium]|nr:UDP-glucose/GDP-mannose dehydrogenase family protein [Pseudomonadota bacterium]